jgi:hypothetical protein
MRRTLVRNDDFEEVREMEDDLADLRLDDDELATVYGGTHGAVQCAETETVMDDAWTF